MIEEPKQIGIAHDWSEARAVNDSYIALKRDGTLWEFAEVPTNTTGPIHRELLQVGTNRDWKSVSIIPVGGSRLALRNDGTLWTWGGDSYLTYGMWGNTNFPRRKLNSAARAIGPAFPMKSPAACAINLTKSGPFHH